MKKIFLILVLLISLTLPRYSHAQEDESKYQLYFGSFYGNNALIFPPNRGSFLDFGGMYAANPFLGLEINYKYVGFLQTVEVLLLGNNYNYKIDDVGLAYYLGLRTYLGTSYVFIDLMLGTGFFYPTMGHKKNISWLPVLWTAKLGTRIPLNRLLDLQLSLGISLPTILEFGVGLNFKL